MRVCFVTMPFGEKVDFRTGRKINFDATYNHAIKPAVLEAGLECVRADEIAHAGALNVPIYSHILGSDVMIADLTTYNPNVFYELGLRHAVRPRVTIILMSDDSVYPFDVDNQVIIKYRTLGEDLPYKEVIRLREVLTSTIRARLESVTNDSPIYDFFPALRVSLPAETPGAGDARGEGPEAGESVIAPPAEFEPEKPLEELWKLERTLREVPGLDPFVFIAILRRYRDLGAWDEVVRLADNLPRKLQSEPEVSQMLALALNRRGETGDQERAISVIEGLIALTGGDGESYGILGRIYKDRYEKHEQAGDVAAAARDLEAAINYYRTGFEKDPSDYYPGVNVVTLLLRRRDPAARAELETILPQVREAVRRKIELGPAGFWELATALQLACVSGDWDEAEQLLGETLKQRPPAWMLQTTIRDLESLQVPAGDEEGRERLRGVVRRLRDEGLGKEAKHA